MNTKTILTAVTGAFLALLVGVIALISTQPMPTDKPLEVKSENVVKSGCSTLTGEKFNSCCDEELQKNKGTKVACIGNWQLENQQCHWACTK